MLINENTNIDNHVKFVEYTGEYPNLCRGILTLIIDKEIVNFGHNYRSNWETDGNYDSFWISGGGCGFNDNYTRSYTKEGEWVIDVAKLPEKYQKYAREIDEVFNDNVEWGCCGGCI